MTTQAEDSRTKVLTLMEENKDLKKRIREVMQTEMDYQDSIAVLKVLLVLYLEKIS